MSEAAWSCNPGTAEQTVLPKRTVCSLPQQTVEEDRRKARLKEDSVHMVRMMGWETANIFFSGCLLYLEWWLYNLSSKWDTSEVKGECY